MNKWECSVCGYVYDPTVGDTDHEIAPGTAFEDLPDSWFCPNCGVGKEFFNKVQ
jgi:rubredoxin